MSFIDPSSEVWKTLASICKDEELRLYDLERMGADSLRVSVERAEGGSVTSGDCSRLCRRLIIFFTAEGPSLGFGTEPEIEVSSPGINRQLRLVEHFERAAGERVKVVGPLLEGANIENPPAYTAVGELLSLRDGIVTVKEEKSGSERTFSFQALKRANVEFKF